MNPPNIIKTKTWQEFQNKVCRRVGQRHEFHNQKGYVFTETGRPKIFVWEQVK